MLEKAPDDRTHPDVFRDARYTRFQRAHAAHDQIDFDTGSGCFVERGNCGRLEQRVHLGDDPPFPSILRVLRLVMDRAQDLLVQRERRLPQVFKLARPAQSGKLDEDVAHVGAHLLVGCKQAEIGIELRRARMVVPG